MFERVVCGIDGSPEALEAARQAARLAGHDGLVVLVAVLEPSSIVFGQSGEDLAETRRRLVTVLQGALDDARDAVGSEAKSDCQLLEREPAEALVEEAERVDAGLIAVGSHGRTRARGIVLGGVATGVLHKAPRDVLVARRPADPAAFPRAIVVGVDGSLEAQAAFDVASDLAGRFDASLTCVAGQGGKGVDLEPFRSAAIEVATDPHAPVVALVSACEEAADLLVVGSRGLHGLRALGSVSERLAHRAPCSVLVVRRGEPPGRVSYRRVKVRDIMVAPAVVVREDATLEEAAATMLEHRIGGLPVVDDAGRLCGMLTGSDFVGEESQLEPSSSGYSVKLPKLFGRWLLTDELERLYEEGRSLPVRQLMRTPVVTATEDEPVQAVVERMIHYDLNRIPVVRERTVVGIVARQDLLRLMASAGR